MSKDSARLESPASRFFLLVVIGLSLATCLVIEPSLGTKDIFSFWAASKAFALQINPYDLRALSTLLEVRYGDMGDGCGIRL